jgi:signal transduction histidine kinase
LRPTIDEQLGGAARLLRLAESDPEASPGVAELARNARRLVERVASSWSVTLPFLREDNDRIAALLDEPHFTDSSDLAAAAARNEDLRARLARRIHALPPGPDREAIGAYLRARVAVDPT